MIDEPADVAVTPQTDGPPEDAPRESVGDVFARLYQDARAYAAAEADKQKLRASIVGAGLRNAAILGVVALMLLFACILALMVGLIIALAQVVAPIWATLIVAGGGFVVAILLLLGAKSCITRMKKAITP